MKKKFGELLDLLTDSITGWIWVPYAVLWVVSFVLAIINGSQTEETCMTRIVAFLVLMNFFYFFYSSLEENYLMGGILRCIWFALPSVLAIMVMTDSLTPVWNVIFHWVYLLYVLGNIALSVIRVGMGEGFRTKSFGFISFLVQFVAYIICIISIGYDEECTVQTGFLIYFVSFLLLLVSLSVSIMMFKMIWTSGYDEEPSDAWYKKFGRGIGRVIKTVLQAIWTFLVVFALYMTMGVSFDFGGYFWVAFAVLLVAATVVLTVVYREYVCDAIDFVAEFSLLDTLTDWEMALNSAAYRSAGSRSARPSNTSNFSKTPSYKSTAADKDDWSKPVDKRKMDSFGYSLRDMLDRRFKYYDSSTSCEVSVGFTFSGMKITINGTHECSVGYVYSIAEEICSKVESVLDEYIEAYRGCSVFDVYVSMKLYDYVTHEYLDTATDSAQYTYTS